jgi:glycosyltransferase involved in cell wall biosynthesis
VTTVLLIFNERENVRPLVAEVLDVYRTEGIDDELSASHGNVRVFHHRADPDHGHPIDNWNRAWTILHGIQQAKGEIVIIMDGDRQYQPKEIPAFLRKMGEGWDVVSGFRHDRADTWYRRLQSRTYNRVFISGIFGMDVLDQNSGFKAFKRSFALTIPFDPRGYKGIHRFILPLCYIAGGSITEIPVEHYDRKAGRSYIKTSTVPFLFLSDLVFRFYPRYRKELSQMRKVRKVLGRMPGPNDSDRVKNGLGGRSYIRPER